MPTGEQSETKRVCLELAYPLPQGITDQLRDPDNENPPSVGESMAEDAAITELAKVKPHGRGLGRIGRTLQFAYGSVEEADEAAVRIQEAYPDIRISKYTDSWR